MKKIITLMICLLTMSFAHAQLTSVAMVGSGTQQGWPADPQIDAAVMTSSDGENWSADNVALLNGAVKFRGNNSWTLPYNWGGSTFPTGTAVVDANGITSAAGVYDVTFNSTTGVYAFVLQTNVFPLVGMVGNATAGGWDVDTDMTTTDGVHYSLRTPLLAGALKFRLDHSWTPTTNWGGDTFPSGIGTLDGAAITVPANGTYNVTFNRTTAEYSFSFPSVAIVGPGAEGTWPNDPQIDLHPMATADGVNYTIASITLAADNAKFRANNSWGINWGATTFPSGTAVLDSPDSFLCTAGTYSATFNYETGAYSFTDLLAVNQFNSSAFKVYPNPTQADWNFKATSVITNIEIVNVLGKSVMSLSPKSDTAMIDASGLKSGVYFAKVSTATATMTIKVVRR